MFLRIAISVFFLAGISAASAAQDRADAKSDDGSVTGVVRYEGDIPRSWRADAEPAVPVAIAKDSQLDPFAMKPPKSVALTAAGHVRNALVVLENESTKAASRDAETPALTLDQIGSMFVPYATVVPRRSRVLFKNSDGINHNVRLISERQARNFYLSGGSEREIKLNLPDQIQVVCDLHAWMRGQIWVVETPYYAVTDLDGRFEIKGVKPGTYQMRWIHPRLTPDAESIEVVVKAGEAGEHDLVMTLGGR